MKNLKNKMLKYLNMFLVLTLSCSLVIPAVAIDLNATDTEEAEVVSAINETEETIDEVETADEVDDTDNEDNTEEAENTETVDETEKAENTEEVENVEETENADETENQEAEEQEKEEVILADEVDEVSTTVKGDMVEVNMNTETQSHVEDIEVVYVHTSNYIVTIPKKIVLGNDKRANYSVKVKGDISEAKQVCVVPVDGNSATDVFDFYMKDAAEGSSKADVLAEVNQAKFYWNAEEVASGYEETGNYIVAEGLSDGNWKGTLQMKISLEDSAAHVHNYTSKTIKEATCTEAGEKVYTCNCGDSYTETVPATGHNYVKGECENCGAEQPCEHVDENNDHDCDLCGKKLSDCADNDNDHNCDVCGKKLSNHIDKDNNHNCDICSEKLSEHTDENNDHNCDICGEKISVHTDNDNNHICDVCGEKVSEHRDNDNNHDCDICNEKLSDHKDEDNDHNCDTCGNKVSDHVDEDNDHNCDTCGEENITDHIDADGDGNCDTCGEEYCEHVVEGDGYKAATCTEDGYMNGTCTKCGKEVNQTIEAVGHNTITSTNGSSFTPTFKKSWINNSRVSYKTSPVGMTASNIGFSGDSSTSTFSGQLVDFSVFVSESGIYKFNANTVSASLGSRFNVSNGSTLTFSASILDSSYNYIQNLTILNYSASASRYDRDSYKDVRFYLTAGTYLIRMNVSAYNAEVTSAEVSGISLEHVSGKYCTRCKQILN